MTLNTGNIQISEFAILGLHGNKNIRLKLEDNTLILVGENGTHKTTILTLFYSFLAGEVEGLAKYEFDSLEMIINGQKYELSVYGGGDFIGELTTYFESSKVQSYLKLNQSFPVTLIYDILKKGDFVSLYPHADKLLKYHEQSLPLVLKHKGMGIDASYELRKFFLEFQYMRSCSDKLKEINKLFQNNNNRVLYFPTYRRIEQDLRNSIELQNKQKTLLGQYIDSLDTVPKEGEVKFCRKISESGMEDIQKLLENKIKFLKNKKTESETYLKNEFAEMAYDEEVYQNISKDDFEKYSSDLIQKVFDRIKKDEQIKPKLRSSLLDPHILEVEESKSLKTLHILKRYIESYQKTFEYEEPLNQLCEACNRYLHSNEIVFDPTKLEVYIRNRQTSENSPERRIDLNQLSSGEKQLVSLFTHLYLADGTQYFVIIDEPEISLSVEWQETFLEDIRNGTFCSGLFVATHSPFMFDNSLRKYAHGVGRFLEVLEPSDDEQ